MNSQWTLIISVFIALAFMLMMAPSVIRLNRGRAVQNIMIWLALFVALGLIYKFFGPEGEFPIISNKNSIMNDELKVKHENEGKTGNNPSDSDETPGSLPKVDEKSL